VRSLFQEAVFLQEADRSGLCRFAADLHVAIQLL
jgi:hypothetical protein